MDAAKARPGATKVAARSAGAAIEPSTGNGIVGSSGPVPREISQSNACISVQEIAVVWFPTGAVRGGARDADHDGADGTEPLTQPS